MKNISKTDFGLYSALLLMCGGVLTTMASKIAADLVLEPKMAYIGALVLVFLGLGFLGGFIMSNLSSK